MGGNCREEGDSLAQKWARAPPALQEGGAERAVDGNQSGSSREPEWSAPPEAWAKRGRRLGPMWKEAWANVEGGCVAHGAGTGHCQGTSLSGLRP